MNPVESNLRLLGVIHEMLTEDTGRHLLDSGGESGRNWQRNQGRTPEQFRAEPEVSADGDTYVISLYHFLERGLDYDDLCHEYNTTFVPAKNHDGRVWGTSSEALEWLSDNGFEVGDTFNSYNHDSHLSQVIQYTLLRRECQDYLLLQVHGGCDVRGGYTDARLFVAEDGWSFEDVYGQVTRADGEVVEVGNGYDGTSITDMDGNAVEARPGDRIELFLTD